ncbi:MBL fold metallo-hydrolase [Naumannella halotolerans]|uniref:Glyoxylase-like metal-dependent hydrolase (Beta-lactamase superfamily II) n=1 Tax=Naumannella halotolerans TaxID=993414 RepID=A0A4R7J0P4_9ACTN|nr:MBL fold metallo-hydrolase [Naumannella halotolerans]TDT29867.1 glyoxylase-like metal-dependent hydrolase (beta-lactamase superfamily II) [Naumannella halotolerans]
MIDLLLAPNPGPMTLDGTNTYLLGDPGEPRVVVDPGPVEDDHLAAILAAAPAGIAEIWLTHHHLDHLAAVPVLAAETGALVRAWRTPTELEVEVDRFAPLADDQRLPAGARAIHIPGHTSDSVGFVVADDPGPVLLTGDMVLGRGTTVITHPDGDVGAYLASLDRMRGLVDGEPLVALLPGHGPRLDDPAAALDHYLRHRQQRLDQVRAVLAEGAQTAEEVVEIVYAEVDASVKQAALWSVRAQLDYLQAED